MKKTILFSAIMCFLIMNANAQINIMDGPKKKEQSALQITQYRYDSLSNFNSELNDLTYVGQKVYCIAHIVGNYYDLYGKTLTIIVKNLDQPNNTIFFLVDEDGNYYEFKDLYSYKVKESYKYGGRNACFVLLGYYDKMKKMYEGKDLIYVNEESDNYTFNGMFDRETHTRNYKIKRGSKWHCEGVGISMDDFPSGYSNSLCNRVVLYLTNKEYGSYYCYTVSNDMDNSRKFSNKNNIIAGKFMAPQAYAKQQKAKASAAKAQKEASEKAAAERVQRLIKAYGEKKANMILQGEVAIGFTKTMCREAWGSPRSVNTTETARVIHEQWVYGNGRYLYFDNGVLTSIQR